MSIHEDILRFGKAFERMIMKMTEVDDFCVELTKDISKQDLSLIGYVGEHGPLIMRDIAEYLDVPFSTATGIVDKLVEKGYFTRYNSEEDRRIVLVNLTRKGKSVEDLFKSKRYEMAELILTDLSEYDRDQLVDILEKITDNLTNLNKAEQ